MEATALLRRLGQLQSDRYNFEAQWQRVAELIWHATAVFQQKNVVQGQRRDQYQFDSTGALALDRFAAALESMLTPRTQKWHKLVPYDKALRNSHIVMLYLEQVNDLLFQYRYAARSGFTTATHESYRSLGAFGNQSIFVEDDIGHGIRYQSQHLGDIYFANNFQGQVDTVYRDFEFTARQAFQMFGDAANGEYRTLSQKSPDQKLEFVHCVMPRSDYDHEARDFKRMPISSYYVCKRTNSIVREGGYFTMPYVSSRFSTAPKETYGRGPAMTVLATLNGVNEMQKTMLRAGQKIVDPPLMAIDDDELRGFNLKSGAINYGALGQNGEQRVKPLEIGSNLPIGFEMTEQERKVINDAFFVTLFQILVETPMMTATEALLRAQEKGALLAPPMGRQQTEFLGPLIQRELDILVRSNRLPPPPPELQEAGGMLDIEYSSPLNRLQDAEEGVGLLRTFEALTPLAAVDPTVLSVFNMRRTARKLAFINGVPMECMKSEEEIEAADEQAAAAEEAAALLQAAPVAGKVVSDLTKMQATAQSSPDLAGIFPGVA